MKKTLFLMLLSILLVFTLVACGGNETPDDNGGENNGGTSGECQHAYQWFETTAPTCTAEGIRAKTCIYCKEEVDYQSIPALGHTEVVLKGNEPSCTRLGYTDGKRCTVCKRITVPQQRIEILPHVFSKYISTVTEPTLTTTGMATFQCETCDKRNNVILDKLAVTNIGKESIYKMETSLYNPAADNVWGLFDGNKVSAGIYATGREWFGNKGDTLTITLDQEITLTNLDIYLAGNWTFGYVTLRNALGKVVKTSVEVKANAAAYGGEAECVNVVKNEELKVYTIEIKVKEIKESYQTFKVVELEMKGIKKDVRLPHDHVYREYMGDTKPATCKSTGLASYACFCGATTEKTIPKASGHVWETIVSYTPATCESKGMVKYHCKWYDECGYWYQEPIAKKGHTYERLVLCSVAPTVESEGEATYMCTRCTSKETRTLSALPIENLKYLRVSKLDGNTVTLKFNINGTPTSYEVRYSTSEITSENFDTATFIDSKASGTKEITITINLDASLTKGYYVAVRPYAGNNKGEVVCVRVGGNMQIPIDYHSANVYHGEVISSMEYLFDEQNVSKDSADIFPQTVLAKLFKSESDTVLYGSNLSPIIDLEYMHYVTAVYLYYNTGHDVKVRWSTTPVDFMAEDSMWDGTYTLTANSRWNEIPINAETRYIQIVFKDGEAPFEVQAYGYQSAEGDKISTEQRELPTLGEMMGMCGFTADGGGNTPIDSVICTTVLREYRNFGWSFVESDFPNKSNHLQSSGMGNLDERYKSYTEAGINVIPCIQWDLAKVKVSNQVDENKEPIFVSPTEENGKRKFLASDFWQRFDPNTYFLYADNMFAFAARYGSNKSASLLEIASQHTNDITNSVGLGYIKWLELGNEPDAGWFNIHEYFSAYQLAALTSAGTDAHCGTLGAIDVTGSHFGAKNADPNMKIAMAGVSGVSNEYITALCYWLKANRLDGEVCIDAFNVHQYMSKSFTVKTPAGVTATLYQGVSPEEADIVGTLSQLVGIRNKYYSDKEVWITEFGWDTNQSYATTNSAHAYGDFTGREVQAMWLTRTYLLLSASGIDKADMFMCEDNGVEDESVGKFGTSGVIAFEYDENGKVVEVKKDSYYYLYTLKNTLGAYKFNSEIEAYDENVKAYEYINEDGKLAYALWCPTSDGTTVEEYCIKVGEAGCKATLVEAEYGDIDGVKTELTVDEYGYVTVSVSEKPIYIVVE